MVLDIKLISSAAKKRKIALKALAENNPGRDRPAEERKG